MRAPQSCTEDPSDEGTLLVTFNARLLDVAISYNDII